MTCFKHVCKWRTNLFYSFFQYLGDIPSTPGDLFSFVLLILLLLGLQLTVPAFPPLIPWTLSLVQVTSKYLLSCELKCIFNAYLIPRPLKIHITTLSTNSLCFPFSPLNSRRPLKTDDDPCMSPALEYDYWFCFVALLSSGLREFKRHRSYIIIIIIIIIIQFLYQLH